MRQKHTYACFRESSRQGKPRSSERLPIAESEIHPNGSAESPSLRSVGVPPNGGTKTRVGRGGARLRCGPKPLYLPKTYDRALTDGPQTVPKGVPGHVCGRPRTGYLVGEGHRLPCPADRTCPVREERAEDGERDATRLSVPTLGEGVEPEVTYN